MGVDGLVAVSGVLGEVLADPFSIKDGEMRLKDHVDVGLDDFAGIGEVLVDGSKVHVGVGEVLGGCFKVSVGVRL